MYVWLKGRMNTTVDGGDHPQIHTLVAWFDLLKRSLQWKATCLVNHNGTPQLFHWMENLASAIGISTVADACLAVLGSGTNPDQATSWMKAVDPWS
jgi:hypothetical protein